MCCSISPVSSMLEGHLKRKYIYLKKNDWKVRQYLFGKLFRQTISSRWVEKWHNFFSENHLDNQPQTDELKSETIFFSRKIIETNNLKQMSWKVRQFLFRKSFRQTTSNRWVPRGCAALDKRLRNDFVRGEIDLGWFVYLSTRHHFF